MKSTPPPPMDWLVWLRGEPWTGRKLRRVERQRDALMTFIRWHFGDDAAVAAKVYAKEQQRKAFADGTDEWS